MKKSLLLTLALALVLALCCVVASAEASNCEHNGGRQRINVVEPTCTKAGSYDELCLLCNKTISTGLPIQATGHAITEADWVVEKEPTCSAVGSKIAICANPNCTDKLQRKEIAKVDCQFSWVTVQESTCTVKGVEAYQCKWCKGVKESNELALKDHVTASGEWITDKAATCLGEGHRYQVCDVCTNPYNGEKIPATGHNMCDWITNPGKEATCTKDGVHWRYCTNKGCDETEEEKIPKTGHKWPDEWTVKTAATCADAGVKYRYCENEGCTEMQREEIAALGHEWVYDYTEVASTTCDESAPIGIYWEKCTRCDWGKNRVEYRLEHTKVTNVVPADCKTVGETTVECSVCKKVFSREKTSEIDPSNHVSTYDKVVTEPTCCETGKTEVRCNKCGILIETKTTEMVAHGKKEAGGVYKLVSETLSTAPTCEKDGEIVYICCYCWRVKGKEVEIEREPVKAPGHDFKTLPPVVVASTCRKEGTMTYVCNNPGCEATYVVTLDKLYHTKDTVTWKILAPASCGVDGIKKNYCTYCKETWYEILPALEHEAKGEGKVTKAAACEEDGIVTYTCKNCGKEYTQIIPQLGHTLGTPVVTTPAACEKPGVETAVCSVCKKELTKEIPALEHVWSEFVVTTAPTCTEDGIKTSICELCKAEKTEKVAAIGHDYVCVIDDPTCTTAGIKTFTCLNCHDSYTEIIPALGHDYETVIVRVPTINRDGEKADICARCGDKQNVQKIEYVAMQFGASMSLDGIKLAELDPTKNSNIRVAVVDTTVDGTYTFNLVADNKWTIGTATVTVANGTVTVNYKVNGFKVKAETITVYSSLDALKADEGIVAANGEPVAFSGNTAFIALDAIVDFCHGDYRVNNYIENNQLIADMKALIA